MAKFEYDKRLCIFCTYFDLSLGSVDFSEYTPVASGYICCDRHHFNFEADESCDYQQVVLYAQNCQDYQYYKDTKDAAESAASSRDTK